MSWIEIASLVISAISATSSALQQIVLKHPGLSERAQALYADALKKWSPNRAILKKWASDIPTVDALAIYLNSTQDVAPEVNSLLNIWVDKLLGDDICGPFLREAQQTAAINDNFTAILTAIKAPYNTIYEASSALRSYYSDIISGHHINRQETDILYGWLSTPANPEEEPENRIAVLIAGAGFGKTVILHDLLVKLEEERIPVLGIKSDIVFDSSDSTIDKALNLGAPAASVIKEIALDRKVVVLIDQIDALSAVLSADRRPLSSIAAFIDEITLMPNVRVIVSCRQYDFDYEKAFAKYQCCQKVRVQELIEDNVDDALRAAGINYTHISGTVKTFLRSPLNLFLYCRLKNRTRVNQTPTLQELYGSLWQEIIIDKAGSKTSAIVKCLDEITTEMSRRQVLTINTGILPTESAHQRRFLISNNFLNDVRNDNIQFIHQTLFEYVTARLFVEKGKTLDDLFYNNKHQGLFIRPQLKQILDYQRSVDPQTYITNIREILFAKDNQGKDKYRFQLKHLVITTLAYYPIFIENEKAVARHLLQDPDLSPVILSAISTVDGIELLWEYICDNGGAQIVDSAYLRSYLNAVCIVGETDIRKATTYLTNVIDVVDDAELRRQFVWAIDTLPVGEETSAMLWTIIKKYGKEWEEIDFSRLLSRLFQYDSKSVGDYLISLLKDYVKENTNKWACDVPNKFETVSEQLQADNPIAFLPIGLQMLDIILASSEEVKGDDIRSSIDLFLYNRHNSLQFNDWLLGKLIDTVEMQVESGSPEIDTLLNQLAATDMAAKHIIALGGWRMDVNRYKDQIYNYLKSTLGKKFHVPYLEYLHQKLFESVFTLLTTKQQETLIRKIDYIMPDWESVPLDGVGEGPLLKVGYTKAQYYSLIPEDILKKYQVEYKAYLNLSRKYKNVEIKEPNHIETRVGWPSVPEAKVLKMSKKDLINLAKTYDKDDYWDLDKPTRRGIALEFSSRAAKEPGFMYEVYSAMLDDDPSLCYHVVEGLEGLRIGQCEETKVAQLVERVISHLPDDVNTIDPTVAFNLIRESDKYIKTGTVPPKALWKYLVKVALTAKEENDSTSDRVDVNNGINQLRGSAVWYLVQLCYCKEYVNQLFAVLSDIAKNGSVATRCALLFQMALLIRVDRQKTLQLFLTAVSRDYNVNLLRLPLHNLNPLVYLVKTDFEALKGYFEECIKHPTSHESNIVILFAAWLRDTPGAEDLTYRMADSSVEGKYHLIRYICKVYNHDNHEKCMDILHRYMNKDEKKVGKAYDEVAKIFGRWNRATLRNYVSLYLTSPEGRYAAHYTINFLKDESRSHPEDCLQWISTLYKNQKDFADRYVLSEYIQILIEAYNNIRKYDSNNKILDYAMDMFDEILRNNVNDRSMGRYLREIS